MRTLILMRHAKAVSLNEADSDKARRLAGRGRRESALAGAAIEDAGLKPTLALVSTSQRTRETAEYGLQNFALETQFDEALYHAAPENIWDAFSASEAECVVMIGHNPGMGELVTMLVHQAHDNSKLAREFGSNFPTAAFAAFEIKGDLLRAAGPRLVAAWKPPRE